MKIILAWFILMTAIICGKSCEAQAYTDNDVIVATIILEAGGEYHVGALEAVYEVIMTRAEKRKKTPDNKSKRASTLEDCSKHFRLKYEFHKRCRPLSCRLCRPLLGKVYGKNCEDW